MLLCIGTCNTKRDPLLNNIMDVRLVGKKETGHLAKDARSPNLDLANLVSLNFNKLYIIGWLSIFQMYRRKL